MVIVEGAGNVAAMVSRPSPFQPGKRAARCRCGRQTPQLLTKSDQGKAGVVALDAVEGARRSSGHGVEAVAVQ